MRLLKVREASLISGLSSSTLNSYRYKGRSVRGIDHLMHGPDFYKTILVKDVHYIVKGQNVVLYCEEEFTHWARYGHTEYHQQWLKTKAQETAKTAKQKRSA